MWDDIRQRENSRKPIAPPEICSQKRQCSDSPRDACDPKSPLFFRPEEAEEEHVQVIEQESRQRKNNRASECVTEWMVQNNLASHLSSPSKSLVGQMNEKLFRKPSCSVPAARLCLS